MTKRYKVVAIILIIYFVGVFLIYSLSNIRDHNRELTILVGDNTIWNYSNKDWLNITREDTINELNWQDYKIYLDNKYFGEYSMWYDDNRWYAFNKDKTSVELDGELIAYQANYDLKIKEFEEKEIINNSYVQKVLQENDLSTSSQLTVNSVINIDIDNDQQLEEFYVISNAFASDFYPDTIFSIVFMVKDNKIYSMYTNIEDAKYGNSCKPYIRTFLDVNDDNIYEVIVTCAKYSIQEPDDMLYQLNKDKFNLVISNQ